MRDLDVPHDLLHDAGDRANLRSRSENARLVRPIVRELRRSERTAALRLANDIDNDPTAVNAASPAYMKGLQRTLKGAVARHLGDNHAQRSLVTILHPRCGAHMGRLTPTILDGLEDRVREALVDCGITSAFGGISLIVYEHEGNRFRAHYRPQARIVVRTNEVRGAERLLRSHFPTSGTVPRSVTITSWYNDEGAVADLLKSEFDRRVRLASGSARKCALRPQQTVEIALAMNEAGPTANVFLHGLQLERFERNNADGLRYGWAIKFARV